MPSTLAHLPLDVRVRYEYATLTPSLRPPSQLAVKIKDRWMHTLFDMLNDIDAAPEIQNPSTGT